MAKRPNANVVARAILEYSNAPWPRIAESVMRMTRITDCPQHEKDEPRYEHGGNAAIRPESESACTVSCNKQVIGRQDKQCHSDRFAHQDKCADPGRMRTTYRRSLDRSIGARN